MTSTRLKAVYNSAVWRNEIRPFVIRRAGGRCQWLDPATKQRCPVRDKNYGGTTSLTVDHTNDDAHPLDVRWLKALCRPHHGKKDGGKRLRRKTRIVRI